ncbi:MAG: ABC transporter substrate-binding protein [Clostridia bacterium]|nr:ABC transporter substrate-binding protein [Clostridia bacterium]
MLKKILAILFAVCMVLPMLASCGRRVDKPSVYYLNFKPEQDVQWKELAAEYTEETGIPVTVVTAASGNYEQTLTSEMDKKDAPTLFQVNGPVGLANWKDYCYNFDGSAVLDELVSDAFALREDGKTYGIAYVIETYGIIYNRTLLDVYFNSNFSTVKSIGELNNFAALKTVAEEIQANKAALGVDGAFTSAGMDSSSDWRFKTHLANMPIYYEYKDRGVANTAEIEGMYLDNYREIWELYINNSTTEPSSLASKTATDAETEFKTGRAVFYQNGTWAYDALKRDDSGSGLSDSEFGMLPIYIGVGGEENQGLCTGSENYWCVNAKASEEDIQATLDFLYWVVTSEEGTDALADDMGFVAPFKNAKEADNPLVRIANNYIEDGKTSVSWNFSTIPSENWKNGVGTALTQYAAGNTSWESVESAFINGWKNEYAAAHK